MKLLLHLLKHLLISPKGQILTYFQISGQEPHQFRSNDKYDERIKYKAPPRKTVLRQEQIPRQSQSEKRHPIRPGILDIKPGKSSQPRFQFL